MLPKKENTAVLPHNLCSPHLAQPRGVAGQQAVAGAALGAVGGGGRQAPDLVENPPGIEHLDNGIDAVHLLCYRSSCASA